MQKQKVRGNQGHNLNIDILLALFEGNVKMQIVSQLLLILSKPNVTELHRPNCATQLYTTRLRLNFGANRLLWVFH